MLCVSSITQKLILGNGATREFKLDKNPKLHGDDEVVNERRHARVVYVRYISVYVTQRGRVADSTELFVWHWKKVEASRFFRATSH